MNCKNCGSELRSDALFCTNCGTKIDAEAVQQEANAEQEPTIESQEPTIESKETQEIPVHQEQQQPEYYQPPPEQFGQQQGQFSQQPGQFQPMVQGQTKQQPGQIVQQPWQLGQQPGKFQPMGQGQTNQQPGVFGQQPGQFGQQQIYSGPPPIRQNKSKTGLIIGLVIGAVLVAAAFFIGIELGKGMDSDGGLFGGRDRQEGHANVTPSPQSTPAFSPNPQLTPTPTPAAPTPQRISDAELIGVWELISGDYLWFFGESSHIMFVDYENGTLGAYSPDNDEWGTGHIDNSGNLVIETVWGSSYDFKYEIDGDDLTLSDIDGDTAFFKRSD